MRNNIIPILAMSGALTFGLGALPATALAGETASLTPEQAALVSNMTKAEYQETLEADGLDSATINKLLAEFDQYEAQMAAEAKQKEQAEAADAEAEAKNKQQQYSKQKPADKTASKATKKLKKASNKAANTAKATKKSKTGNSKHKVAVKRIKDASPAKSNDKKIAKAKHAKTAQPTQTESQAEVSPTPTPSYQRIHYSQNLTTSMFIASIGEQARQIGQKYHLYASVLIAQAILESGSGSSVLSRPPYNNLFGIKGAFHGHSITMATKEETANGTLYGTTAAFRVYANEKQSMRDYAKLLRENALYSGTWKENADSYKDAADALQGRYATDSNYAAKIKAIIKTYKLNRFDKKLDFKITGTKMNKNGKVRNLNMGDYANLEALATSCMGTPYVWGGNTTEGFDCSGLVQYLYQKALGINLPRTTYQQQNVGKMVDFDDLQMGDLLFFQRGTDTYHVAMYLGDGFYIHAPNRGETVKIGDMESYTPSFAKRVITTKSVKHSSKAASKENAADND
ncbi:MAG: glucosaminidase domain-containing protein [Eggerthellaceae bacterium]|jgi:flagellum-specific peptidoglycan hydrolase FlgJ